MTELTIVKIGGKLLESQSFLSQTLQHFASIKGPKILVHGGGKAASEKSKALGIQPNMVDGRRVTDAATLEVATMVYAGLENKKVVSQLQARSCDALGFSGADANTILAKKRAATPVDYGLVGDIQQVNAARIQGILQLGLSPVFCAITHDGKGQLFNTNADTIAAEVAKAMSKHFSVKLFYCFEKAGVLADPEDESTVIPVIDQDTFAAGKESGAIAAGMLPKLENAFQALEAGVDQVIIGNPASLSGTGGTRLTMKALNS